LVAANKEAAMIDPKSPASSDSELTNQAIAACQSVIARTICQLSQALRLVRGLDAALTSLKLVQSEVGKGANGARAVIDNAEAITRHALKDLLNLAEGPQRALEALATAPPREPAPPSGLRMPTFGEMSLAYIDMRIANDGPDHPDIAYLRMRRRTFIDIVGDRAVDQYYPRDLQTYVSRMQFWPANAVKRGEFENLSTLEILEANKEFSLKPIARKTLQDGYAANIKTMMRSGMGDYLYRDPFAGAKIRWPQMLQAPVPREGIGFDVLDRVFSTGTQSGVLVEAMLPLLSALTSRRLGLLTYMRGSDIREKYGVMIVQTGGIVLENGRWRRVPAKTEESMPFLRPARLLQRDRFRRLGTPAGRLCVRRCARASQPLEVHFEGNEQAAEALRRYRRRRGIPLAPRRCDHRDARCRNAGPGRAAAGRPRAWRRP
jgi:hypothetical protein